MIHNIITCRIRYYTRYIKIYSGVYLTEMPDYKKMYCKLFGAVKKAITILQEAQQETEEIYISSEPTDITELKTRKKNSGRQDNKD